MQCQLFRYYRMAYGPCIFYNLWTHISLSDIILIFQASQTTKICFFYLKSQFIPYVHNILRLILFVHVTNTVSVIPITNRRSSIGNIHKKYRLQRKEFLSFLLYLVLISHSQYSQTSREWKSCGWRELVTTQTSTNLTGNTAKATENLSDWKRGKKECVSNFKRHQT